MVAPVLAAGALFAHRAARIALAANKTRVSLTVKLGSGATAAQAYTFTRC